MMRKASRRKFLIVSAAAATGLVFTQHAEFGAASSGSQILSGTIESIGPGPSMQLRAGRERVALGFTAAAEFFRDGRVSLTEFAPGDEVVARVRLADVGLVADLVSTLYRQSDGLLDAADDQSVSVAGSTFTLTDRTLTLRRRDLGPMARAALRPGSTVEVLHRREPARGRAVAARILA